MNEVFEGEIKSMTYTVKMEIFLDDDTIMSESQMSKALKELLECASISVSDVRILDINN